MRFITKTPDQTRQRGHTLYLYISYLSRGYLVRPPPASLLFSRLSGLAATEPNLSCLRSPPPSFHPSLPRFPHRVSASCTSSPRLRPPRSRPSSRPRSHPRSHLRYCSRFRPRSRPRSHPMFVLWSPPPSSFRVPPRPRSRPRPHLALLRSPLLPFSFPLRSCSHHRSRPRSHP